VRDNSKIITPSWVLIGFTPHIFRAKTAHITIIIYIVRSTVYTIQCILYSVYTVYTIQCILYTLYTLYSVYSPTLRKSELSG